MAKRWSKQPSETGLARVAQKMRGFILKDGGKELAGVYPTFKGLSRELAGWYWVAEPIGKMGTFNSLWEGQQYDTADDAKEAVMRYIRAHSE